MSVIVTTVKMKLIILIVMVITLGGGAGGRRGICRVLVVKSGGKRPLGRSRRRWDDNIKMDLQEEGCGDMDWIDLAQDRDRWRALANAVMTLWAPLNEGNFFTS